MNHYHIYHEEIPDFIKECLRTDVMQRLKEVGMNCGCEYTSFPRFRNIESYSRFDHSVGVALIVWHFTESPAQSIAGLLHDIATPAFAHVVDFMRGDYMKQEATEEGTREMISGSVQLQNILKKTGLSTDEVYDYHRYPIADNDSPRLSADRLEYTLGNCINYRIRSKKEVRSFYDDIKTDINEEGEPELAFETLENALDFALAALECSKIYVSDEDRYSMQMLSELLNTAVNLKVISEKELYLTEPVLIEKLRSDRRTARLWEDFCAFKVIIRNNNSDGGCRWRKVFAKKRCIDPLVKGYGRVSALSNAFADELNAFLSAGQDYWICASEA